MAEEISGERLQEPENLDPQCVVDVFVKKYYAILENTPDIVHKFYKDESVIKRPRSDGGMESVTTMQNINDAIMSSDYKGCSAEILNADFQESLGGGIIVAVNGYLTVKDNLRKSFYQTFFLARQERGYFVLNDILRFTDVHDELTPSACSDTTISSLSVHLTPALETATIPEPTNASVVEDDIKNVSEVKDDIKMVPEVKDDIKKASSEVKESIPVAQIPKEPSPPKTSYASMVAKPSKVTAPTVTVSVVVKTGSTADQQPKASTVVKNHVNPSNNTAKGLNSSNNGTENNGSNGDAMTRSVYIGNLPSNITKNALIDALKDFGRVKQDGIQLRTFEDGFCFGFVEFESVSSARKAVEVHNYTIGGNDAYILFKRSSARSGEFQGNGVNGSRQNGENNFNSRNQISRDNNTTTRGSYGRESYRTNEKRSYGEANARQKDDRLINGGGGFQGNNQRRFNTAIRG